MICKVCGMENPEDAKVCQQCGAELVEEEIVEEEPVQEQPAGEWYYVANGASTGPYSQDLMVQLVQAGQINGETYVWKAGMADWKRLKETELAGWLPHLETQRTVYTPGKLQDRNILLYVILCFVTCGIWVYVWLYQMAKDVNDLLEARGLPKSCDPLVVLLLSLVSCNIYTTYFFWKSGKALAKLDPEMNDTTVMTILSAFIPVISMVILQSDLNDIAKQA